MSIISVGSSVAPCNSRRTGLPPSGSGDSTWTILSSLAMISFITARSPLPERNGFSGTVVHPVRSAMAIDTVNKLFQAIPAIVGGYHLENHGVFAPWPELNSKILRLEEW